MTDPFGTIWNVGDRVEYRGRTGTVIELVHRSLVRVAWDVSMMRVLEPTVQLRKLELNH